MASGAWAPERDRPTSPQPPLQDSGPPQAGRAVPCDTGEGSACSQAPGPGFPGGGPASARTEFGELGPVPPVAAVAAWGPPPRMQPGVCVTCWYTGRSSHRSPRGAPRAGWEETQGNVSEEKGPVSALQAGRCGTAKGRPLPRASRPHNPCPSAAAGCTSPEAACPTAPTVGRCWRRLRPPLSAQIRLKSTAPSCPPELAASLGTGNWAGAGSSTETQGP